MNDKMIINNQDKIRNLFKEFMNINVTDSQYKVGYYNSNDADLYFQSYGENYILRFNDIDDVYVLMHMSKCGFDARHKVRYHKEWEVKSHLGLERAIFMVSTRHNPKYMIKNNKNSVDTILRK